MQTTKSNLQDILLTKLRKNHTTVTLFLMNGFQLHGHIDGFDSFVVFVLSDGKQQMVYKHAISTIVPERVISLEDI
ncbi:MAG: RNA chaperone Hfq [Evtepia sp.]